MAKSKSPVVVLKLALSSEGKLALKVKAHNFAPFQDVEELPEGQRNLLKTALSLVEALTHEQGGEGDSN